MERVASDEAMLAQWATYARKYPYVGSLSLQEACEAVKDIMLYIDWPQNLTN